MPKKGMRTIFFKPNTPQPPSSSTSTSTSSPLRSLLSDGMAEENLEAARVLVSKWDPRPENNPHQLFSPDNSDEARQYLAAVSHLQSAMHLYIAHDPASPNLVLAQTLTQTAINRLEREFYRLLKTLPDPATASASASASVSSRASLSDFDEDAISTFSEDEDATAPSPSPSRPRPPFPPAVSSLRSIAECMVGSGYGKECAKIYKIMRKSAVDESLYHLGVERLSLSQVQKMEWDSLQLKVKTWLAAVKVAVKAVFDGERLLCDAIFSSSSSFLREACFSEVVTEGATALFSFPEHVARCKKSTEKLFRLLDLYESISDLWPYVESVFDFDSTSAIRSIAVSALIKLGEAVRATLTEFDSAISKDNSKASVPGGGVHPLTRYVMNYLSFLGDYIGPLSDIVADWPLPSPSRLPEAYFGQLDEESSYGENGAVVSSNASLRVAWLVLVLLCKLDGKAERYSDVALSYLFLANNLRYVVNKVRSSNLRFLLREDWVQRHEAKLRQYVSNYERMGWAKVVAALTEGANGEGAAPVAEVVEKFRRFNAAFEEAHARQSAWVVTDPKLRDEIRVSLARKIDPIYREFYEKYRPVVIANVARERGMGPAEGIVRFAPHDLGNYLSDLFYGGGSSGNTASLSSLSVSSAPSASSSSSGHSRGRRSR